MTRTLLTAAALAAAMLASGRTGLAAPSENQPAPPAPVRVILESEACSPAVAAEMRRVVTVELGPVLLDADHAPPADADRLRITCSSDTAVIEARSAEDVTAVTRTLRLDTFPGDVAPRALALAAIEVLAALNRRRAEGGRQRAGSLPPPPAPPARAATPAVVVAEPPPRTVAFEALPLRAPPLEISVSAVRRAFLAPHGLTVWGASLDAERVMASRWNLDVGLEVAASSSTDAGPLGQARGLVVSAAGFFGIHGERAPVSGTVALGGRVGIAHFTSTAAPGALGGEITRPWGGLALATEARVVRRRLELRLTIEAGLALIGTEALAADATALAVRGGWVAISLGPGVRVRS
jgi:hypothetical protein